MKKKSNQPPCINSADLLGARGSQSQTCTCIVFASAVGIMAVVWWYQNVWRAAGYWTWAVAVGETATC